MLATAMFKWVMLAAIAVGLLLVLTYMFFTVGQRGRQPQAPEQSPEPSPDRAPEQLHPNTSAHVDPRRPDPIGRRRRLRTRQPHRR
jgi:hypothetical protein